MRWDLISGTFRVYEKGASAPTSTTTVAQNFSPEEAAQRALVQQEAARVYNETAGAISASPYPGSKPIGFSPESQQAQTSLAGYATGAGAQQAAQAGGYSSWLMGPAQYAEANPYLQSAMNAAIRPVTQQYTDPGGVFSQIRTGAQQAGQFGSTRQGIAEGIAGRGYLDTVGDITSRMANENYQAAAQRGTQALALSPQTYNLGTQPSTTLAAVGTQKELLSQAEEDYAAQSRAWDLNAPWTPLQNYANIVFGGSSPGTTSTSTGSAPQTNRFASALGGAATGASIGSVAGPWGAAIGGAAGLMMSFLQ